MNQSTDDNQPQRPQKMLTVAGGGWVILLAIALCLGAALWLATPALLRGMDPPLGDGINPESYGFDLSLVNGDRDALTAGMRYRDMVHPLTMPPRLSVDEVNAKTGRKKYMVPSDLVIGVAVGDEARAYPLHVLNVHEIVNDTVGNKPIAVTYHWPSGGIRVFERTMNEQILELGVSGLLYNGNAVYYDRKRDDMPTTQPSLWNQLEGTPLAGPAAQSQQTLNTYPTQLTTWASWLAAHPETTVIDRDPTYARVYKKSNPQTGDPSYFTSNVLPNGTALSHTPDADSAPFKERVIVVTDRNNKRYVYPYNLIAAQVDGDGNWIDETSGQPIRFSYVQDPEHVSAVYTDSNLPINAPYSFWFAWHALHPKDELMTMPKTDKSD
ncbi:MAG: DUF3179 domain-containing (seleno)protein [Phycisphaerales bacterium]|nr:DUF3179 domain-containing (seleno)protein [Phycisphaerales bacterium]